MWRANRKDFTMKHARWPPIDEFLCQKPLLGHHDFQLMGVQSVRISGFIYFLFTHCCATGRKKETSSFWNFMLHRFPKCHRRAQLDPLGGAQATLRSNGVRACFTGDKCISGALKPVFFSSAWIIKEVTSLNWNHNVVTWSMELQSKKCEISPTLKYYLGGLHLRVNFERWSADIMRGPVRLQNYLEQSYLLKTTTSMLGLGSQELVLKALGKKKHPEQTFACFLSPNEFCIYNFFQLERHAAVGLLP